MPFPVRGIQVDGGGEFCAEFEQACQQRKIPLIVLPPYSPKMNTRVEYVHGTCRREFYERTEMAADLKAVRRQWAEWEDTYHGVWPHESLGLKTPIESITPPSSSRARSHMSLYEGHPLCKSLLGWCGDGQIEIAGLYST